MRIFLTGATGFIGSHLIPELKAAGHTIVGLTRSEAGARRLEAAGVQPYHGSLEEPDSLTRGAAEADAVIHTAFDHDFSQFMASCEKDGRAIRALGTAMKGSGRTLVVTSGVAWGASAPGEPATEDHYVRDHPFPRVSERVGEEVADMGVSVVVMRLPQVHDTVKQGIVTPLKEIARARGVSAYVGEGGNRYAAAHVSDVARLYRLAVEQAKAGERLHAVDEEGITARAIAETLAEGLGVPAVSVSAEQAAEHFGFMSHFAAMDLSASSAWTRQRFDWTPTGPGLIHDLQRMDYSAQA
jgi:nucleoside-diphosphate-sugar epimerase